MNSVEPSMAIPVASSSGSKDNPAMERSTLSNSVTENEVQTQNVDQLSSDLGTSQDYGGGMMKVVPSDVDVSVLVLNLVFLKRRCGLR